MCKKKIAIIGAGFYGCTAALVLSKDHDVEIFEKENDILNSASKINQFRFHRGYHYPRSQKTIDQIKHSYKKFTKFYGKNVLKSTNNYYAISKKNSLTSFDRYIKILKKNKLFYKKIINEKLFSNLIEGAIESNEKTLNYFKIKKKITRLLKKYKIKINFSALVNKKMLKDFDKIIVCTYANNNQILKTLGVKPITKYRFELIEKIIVKLPPKFKNLSLVVLDGKFVCLDPYIGTKYHLFSDVKHSKIEIINSKLPCFKSFKKKLINNTVHKNIKISNYKKFIDNSKKYLPFITEAKYIGSFFITRTIKSNVEKTDERTTEIKKINNKVYTIFSSKWNGCVSTSEQLQKKLNEEN